MRLHKTPYGLYDHLVRLKVLTLLLMVNVGNVVHSAVLPCTEYVIVGAGAAGIQMGVYLQHHGLPYIIFEKGQDAGTFWLSYPVTNELISVNSPPSKQNKSVDPRYEWHGLLNTSVAFKTFSTRFFPLRSEYHEYLNSVVAVEALHVEWGVEVVQLLPGPCVRLASGQRVCARRIFVATGLEEIPRPKLDEKGIISYSNFHRSMVDGEKVCIFGNGNSAWELAQASFQTAEAVSVIGRRPTRWSMVTKYTGDVRIKYAQTMENFHSKLKAFASPLVYNGEPIGDEFARDITVGVATHSYPESSIRNLCTVSFHAWGFRSRLLGGSYGGLFPADLDTNKTWYESRAHDRVHYIGWHMHKHDFRQGAGGFASGFRYLIRNLWQHVQAIDQPRTALNEMEVTVSEIAPYVAQRIQSADDIVIMQDGNVLRDVIELIRVGDHCELESSRWRYLSGWNYNFLTPRRKLSAATIYFAWGTQSRDASTIWNEQFHVQSRSFFGSSLRNILLHPVIEWRGFQVHLMEQPLNDWEDIIGAVQSVFDELLPLIVSTHCGRLLRPRLRLSPRWIRPTMGTRGTSPRMDDVEVSEEQYLKSMEWLRQFR